MLAMALNTERLKERHLNASALLSEVSLEYARASASIIFRHLAESAQAESAGGATSTGIFDGIELPPVVKKAVPEKGTVEVGGYDGSEAKSAFAFSTFLSKPQIIAAVTRVRAECNKVEDLSLFHTSFTKSIMVEEYAPSRDEDGSRHLTPHTPHASPRSSHLIPYPATLQVRAADEDDFGEYEQLPARDVVGVAQERRALGAQGGGQGVVQPRRAECRGARGVEAAPSRDPTSHVTPHLTAHIPHFRCTPSRSCAASCAWSIL